MFLCQNWFITGFNGHKIIEATEKIFNKTFRFEKNLLSVLIKPRIFFFDTIKYL